MGSDYKSSEDERKEKRQEELVQKQGDEKWEREAEMSTVAEQDEELASIRDQENNEETDIKDLQNSI